MLKMSDMKTIALVASGVFIAGLFMAVTRKSFGIVETAIGGFDK